MSASACTFIDRSGLGILLVDGEGRIRAAGASARQCLGLSRSRRKRLDLAAVVRDDKGKALSNKDALALWRKSRPGLPVECRLRGVDGVDRPALVCLSAWEGEDAGLVAAELTLIDRQQDAIATALKELEHLSSALDATDQGVWDFNGATGVWYFSPAWKRMRGIPVDEDYVPSGNDWLDNVHPDDRDLVRDSTERQYAGELEEVAFEYRERHRDGHWIWVLARGRCLEGIRDGKPLRIVGTDTDITALKNSEAALGELAKSEMRWKIAVDSAEQGVWDIDLVNGERYYSETWRDMRGLAAGEPAPRTGQEWLDRIHPEDRDRVADYLARNRRGEIDQMSLEFRERSKGGGWIWTLRRGKPVARNDQGLPTRFIGIDTDVTDIKEREVEFEALSKRLEMALSTSAVGVWETDLSTGEAFWDARTCELFGMEPSAKAVPPGTWEALLHPEDRERTIAYCAQNLASERGYACDYRIMFPNGVVRHIRCRATIVGGAGAGDKIVGVNWDITADVERAEALRRAKQLAEDRSRELEAAHRRMEHASMHDSLTGLPNRRYLDAALAGFALVGATDSLALLHIDLDRFKQINDTKGHAAGDALLVHMAKLLRGHVSARDVVARIGGDEFVILMSPAPDRETLQAIVDRIIADAGIPLAWNGTECRSGVSIGMALASPGIDARQLLVNADIALYRAKRAGRNCACFFTDSLQDEVISKKQWADDILKGLERQEFEPWFQLQFDARTLDIIGLEALVRWNHPTRGIVMPGEFLEVARDINAMSAIDRLVLERAASALAQWDAMGIRIPRVSVNVSARRLAEETLVASLHTMPVEPSRVSFELLESIFLDDDNQALTANIEGLKAMGFKIEIDDFGTGHASIASLLRIKPHRLKIDRQLVTPIVESEAQRRLVRSIIDIGKSQGISICAEGVETAAHAEILRELGCDSLQGFHLARPMPASDIPAFVAAASWLPPADRALDTWFADGTVLRQFMDQQGLAVPQPGTRRRVVGRRV